jgi:hypothetical protein
MAIFSSDLQDYEVAFNAEKQSVKGGKLREQVLHTVKS